jgi:hypothetical protein
MLQKNVTITGDPYPPARALKKRDTQKLLQLAHRLCDRRLADVQNLGGSHDTFLARHFGKRLQVA